MPTLLLVEDDAALAELIASYLTRHSFEVVIVGRGDAVRSAIAEHDPDLVVLDLMLPGMDGMEVCRELRQADLALPILMLTARDDNYDQVLGLELGADDYVTKPCEPRVLLARIRTLLRRGRPERSAEPASKMRFGRLCIDLAERTVNWRDNTIELSAGEFDLLVALAQRAGEVQSRDQLLKEVRGIEFNGVDRSVDVAISKLRRKFEDTSGEPRRIKTVWGKGYLFSRSEWED